MPLHPSLNISRCENASEGRLWRVWARCRDRLRQQAGFTIVEVVVAALVLVIGLLVTFNALDLTAHTSELTRDRQGAINLARQITEDTRALQYTSLTSSSAVISQLQAMPGLASTSSGSTWTIKRYNIGSSSLTGAVTYTVSLTETDLPAVTQQTLSQKQITVTVSWTVSGTPHSYTQTSTISSGGQGINMSASALAWYQPPASCTSPCSATAPIITAAMNITTMNFTVQTPAGMSGVAWEVNGVSQNWSSTSTAVNATTAQWTTTTGWDTSNLPDGTYEIGAAAQNGTSTGNYVRIYVRIARGIPSAPSFSTDPWAGAGFDANFYTSYSTTKKTVAELDWSGSNNPTVTSNSGDYNTVGYEIWNPSGTMICETAITSTGSSSLTSTFPGTCVGNANVWCASPTQCTDMAPPSTSGSQVYKVAALYYNSSNVLTAGPTTSVTLSGTGPQTYYLGTTTSNIGTNCPSSGNSRTDLSTSAPTGTTASSLTSTGSSVTATFCGPAFTQATNISTGGSATLYVRNASSSSCTINGYLSIDGGLFLAGSVSVPANTVPTAYTLTWAGGSTWSLNSGDRLDTQYTWGCGSSTKPVTLYWGATGDPSSFATNSFPIQTPNPPTNLAISVATNSDGTTTATLTWNAPTSGPAVHGYRVYRAGQNYNNRYAYDSVTNSASYTCSGGTCTYLDKERTGTYTYAVTAVGNTTLGSNMAESSFAGPTTQQ